MKEIQTRPASACFVQTICRGTHCFFDPAVRVRHETWTLDYFHDDGLRIRFGSEGAAWEKRPARTACLYRPGTVRWQGSIRNDRPIRGAWAFFLPTAASGMEELVPADLDRMHFEDPACLLGRVIDELCGMLDTQPAEMTIHRDLPIVDILLRILRNSEPGRRWCRRIVALPPETQTEILVTRTDFFLRHNYTRPIGRTDIAGFAGLAESQLSRRYAKVAGTTPVRALMNMRAHAAARMLEHGLQLKEVAGLTGFCDTSHLNRVFKSVLGTTPGEFKGRLDHGDVEAMVPLPGSWDYHRSSVALAGAVRLSRETLNPRQRNQYDTRWFLDAFLTPGVKFRAVDGQEPWIEEEPGWLRLYSPGCQYWEDGTRAQRPVVSFSVCFVALPSSAVAIKYGCRPACIRFHDPNRRIITRLQQLSVIQADPDRNALLESQHVFLKLMIRLVRAQPIGPNTYLVVDCRSENPLVSNVEAFLEAHHHEPLSRDAIAEHFGMSVSKLAHLYAEEAGEGPMRTLRKIRIRHARVLLAEGMPVAEVAEKVGFEDAALFSKVFRKSDRMPPSQYQQLSMG